jgi:hypothetical protein
MLNIYQAKGKTLTEQYFDVGTLFGESIRNAVIKISKKRSKQAKVRKMLAEKTLKNLSHKIIAKEFLGCLSAWADGAQITSEQAMWLMSDNLSGCQTMLMRYKTGIALIHTEEDFENISFRMTGEKILSFEDNGNVSRCLVYNDLMPGAGLYGWKRDLIVAVDTLYLREDGIEKIKFPILANIIAWMVWRMSPEEANEKNILQLIDDLGELIDGYVINIVRKVNNVTQGYKITLARTENRVESIGDKVGDYLRQSNIVDPNYPRMKWALPARRFWRGGYPLFLKRLQTMDEHVRLYAWLAERELTPATINNCHLLIQSTIYNEFGQTYINENVGAVCLGLLDKLGTSVSCKLNDQKQFKELEYLDLV